MADKQIIFILDDEKQIANMLFEYLTSKLDYVEVYSFTKYEDLKNHELLNKVSLFIFDIDLENHYTGDQIAAIIHKENPAPFLFMSGKGYSFEYFSDNDLTYDYLSKPFDLVPALNRIKVLLKVSKTYEEHEKQSESFRVSLKELFDYTNIYMIILDKEMKIKLCSSRLAQDLGYKSENELIGKNWKKHLNIIEKGIVEKTFKHVMKNTNEYRKNLKEVSNEIISNEGKSINVKWFNSRISNGNTYSFSIGIPYNTEISTDDSIETIRHHWREMLNRDKKTIRTLKSRI